jgi:FemAB-related protein (PEP-CTERM system-associated)
VADPADVTVAELQPGEEPLWQCYVERSPRAEFFHLLGWKRVVERTYGHETRYLMAKTADGTVRGILPLFVISSRLFGKHVSTPPGAICADEPCVGQKLLEAAIALTESADADDLLLTASKQLWDGDLLTVQRHCTQQLALPAGADALWKSISRHKRKNVNAAGRAGLSVDFGKGEFADFFYQVFAHSLRELGTPIFDRQLLANILDEFQEQTWILVARQGERPVGALLLFTMGETIHAQWAASYREDRPNRPNDLLYWEMLRWGAENGYRLCDMGRSQWGSGNYNFKALWGAETVPLYYQHFMRRGLGIPDFDLKVERDFKFRTVVRTWQHLPIGVTLRLGPYLRKYLYPL